MLTIYLIIIIFIYLFFHCKNNYIIISIEGNIGSGKTTLINLLKDKYKNNKRFIFIEEPINIWLSITDKDQQNVLNKFYHDKNKYSYLFQNFAFITRNIILKSKTKNIFCFRKKYIISERSINADKYIFCKMLYEDKLIEDIEYKIYNYWYDYLFPEFKINKIIYLKTNPNISFERIKLRNRIEEKDIEFQYINKLHEYHENWINEYDKDKICILNGDLNLNNINYNLNLINNFFKSI